MKKYCLLIFLFLVSVFAFANNNGRLPFKTFVFVDDTGELTENNLDFTKFVPTENKFNSGFTDGNVWIFISYDKSDYPSDETFYLDLGSEGLQQAALYRKEHGLWAMQGVAGYGLSHQYFDSSIMRQNFMFQDVDAVVKNNFLLVKVKNPYGATIDLDIGTRKFYEYKVVFFTILHTVLGSIFFTIGFFILAFSIFVRDKIYAALFGILFCFSILQVHLTGVGPVLIWNKICVYFNSSQPVEYLLLCLLHLFIMIFLFLLNDEMTEGVRTKTFNSIVGCECILLAVAFSVCLFSAKPNVMFAVFSFCSIVSFFNFILMVSMMKKTNKDTFPFHTLPWMFVLGFSLLRRLFLICRPMLASVIIGESLKNNYMTNYITMSLIILAPFLTIVKRAKQELDNLRGTNKRLVDELESLEENRKFFLEAERELLDVSNIMQNTMSLPKLIFDTDEKKAIKNIFDYNIGKQLGIFTVMQGLSSSEVPSASPILLRDFSESTWAYVYGHAKRKNLNAHLDVIGIDEKDIIYMNPRILETIIINLDVVAVNLAKENSVLDVSLSYDGSLLSYKAYVSQCIDSNEAKNIESSFDYMLAKRAGDLYSADTKISIRDEDAVLTSVFPVKRWLFYNKSNSVYASSMMGGVKLNAEKTAADRISEDEFLIFLGEDNEDMYMYFKEVLSGFGRVEFFANGLDLWNRLSDSEKDMPDLVICENRLSFLTGEDLYRKAILDDRLVNIPFVMLLDDLDKDKINDLIERGVSYCLRKPFATKEFTLMMHSVISTTKKTKKLVMGKIGNLVNKSGVKVSEEKMSFPAIKESQVSGESDGYSELSKRERQIALLITAGKSDKEISEELGISSATVASHNKNIFKKLNVHSRVELMNKLR